MHHTTLFSIVCSDTAAVAAGRLVLIWFRRTAMFVNTVMAQYVCPWQRGQKECGLTHLKSVVKRETHGVDDYEYNNENR